MNKNVRPGSGIVTSTGARRSEGTCGSDSKLLP